MTKDSQTVFLCRMPSGFANVPDTWRLASDLDDYADEPGYVEDTALYALPTGYRVANTQYGDPMIFADGVDRGCEIRTHATGRPQVWGAEGKAPVLRRVAPDPAP